ncbi:deoxyribose-phosphate aldolase [Erysipelothrix anatis]|uniref:deoxyribose-phosphate aldolase n=1 Tax=Erysipelothrix anatis TaxID=2683713 RepID=UPI001357C0E2|nr:deoxyribose-phosphate aldolase [Erysipelothrix anatis]
MELNQYIDHTLLKPEATQAQIIALCEEAKHYNFMSVCVNPVNVALAAKELAGTDVDVCTVVGFPLGATPLAVKAFEAKAVLEDGATEVDMVINIGALKEGRLDFVENEIRELKKIVGDKVLKVIVESCLLTDDEIATVSQLVVNEGADFVKTSTGFNKEGATVNAVRIMRETVKDKAGVKASGGVRSLEEMNAMIEAGASRIGSSSGVAIMEGLKSDSDY